MQLLLELPSCGLALGLRSLLARSLGGNRSAPRLLEAPVLCRDFLARPCHGLALLVKLPETLLGYVCQAQLGLEFAQRRVLVADALHGEAAALLFASPPFELLGKCLFLFLLPRTAPSFEHRLRDWNAWQPDEGLRAGHLGGGRAAHRASHVL